MCCTTPRPATRLAPLSLLSRALLTALALVTLAIPALAQQTGGTIRGKVQNATNGAYLENVAVQPSW